MGKDWQINAWNGIMTTYQGYVVEGNMQAYTERPRHTTLALWWERASAVSFLLSAWTETAFTSRRVDRSSVLEAVDVA